VESEWERFKQINKRKQDTLEAKTKEFQEKIAEEEQIVQRTIQDITVKHESNEFTEAVAIPSSATTQIKDAIRQLQAYSNYIKKSVIELQRVCRAKELLNMELGNPDQLEIIMEDHNNLLEVWTEVGRVWKNIEKVDATPFPFYVKAQVKEVLDASQNELREFPNKMRSYQVYKVYETNIVQYKKFNELLDELRDDGMKPKHWKDLLGKLKIQDKSKQTVIQKKEDLCLYHLWDADILGRQKVVQDVLTQARGEKILEDFIL